MPDLIGSLVSVATFWASEESSLLCATKASNCLRVWALVSSTASDSDFTPSRSVAKSNHALVFWRTISIVLRARSVAPLLAVA